MQEIEGIDDQQAPRSGKGLRTALLLTATYLVVEYIGGVLTGSLALQADAGHMLSDVASLGVALLAFRFAARPATPRNTYGFYRAEILAAFVNGIVLVAISAFIVYEAFQRISRPPVVSSLAMLLIACVGLLVNLGSAWALSGGQEQSLNEKGAFLHVVADALGSIGAIVAGFVMLKFHWYLADPIISMVISLLIVAGAWRLIRDTTHILMEGAPTHVDVLALRRAMEGVPGIDKVHDLHVWTLTSGMEALSAHVVLQSQCSTEDAKSALARVQEVLRSQFKIGHTTIQVEDSEHQDPPGTQCR
jgi:cobalt-zinc-cadmium efflux system protein